MYLIKRKYTHETQLVKSYNELWSPNLFVEFGFWSVDN